MEAQHQKILPFPIRPAVLFAGFLLLFFLSGIIHLGYYPLNGDEPRRAVVSLEMIHSGNFTKPTTLGWDYYNKPPVYNWLIAASMKLTGSSGELAVRLPSLVFLMIWGFVNFRIIRKIASEFVAALSSVFLVTSFDIHYWGLNNGGEIDIFYSFVVYLQVIGLFYFNQKRNWMALYTASYALCAVGLLTKGFPSILFQGFSLLALIFFNRSPRVLYRWQHLAGLAVFILVAGGYFYLYSFHNDPGIYLADLLKEAFNKSAFGEYPERLLRKVAMYPFSFLKILLPWSLVLLWLLKDPARAVWRQPLVRFSLLFIACNIAPYWFTGHPRMRYVYMFVPFSMLVLAQLYDHYNRQYPALMQRILRWLGLIFLLVALGLVALPFFREVKGTWLAMALAPLAVYLFFYRMMGDRTIWYFSTGLVLVRLAFAWVLLPEKNETTRNKYPHHMAVMAALNGGRPLSIYKKPDRLNLVIDLKLAQVDFGTIPAIPYLAYQMPYYYYRNSGVIVTYDTILGPGRSYIGFRSDLTGIPVEELYRFRDPNQNDEDVLLFRIREKAGEGK